MRHTAVRKAISQNANTGHQYARTASAEVRTLCVLSRCIMIYDSEHVTRDVSSWQESTTVNTSFSADTHNVISVPSPNKSRRECECESLGLAVDAVAVALPPSSVA